MKFFSVFSTDQYVILIISLLIFILLIKWIETPSRWDTPEEAYNECLRVILAQGNITDAEVMCKHLREIK